MGKKIEREGDPINAVVRLPARLLRFLRPAVAHRLAGSPPLPESASPPAQWLGVGLASSFLLARVLTFTHYGVTFDEEESYRAGAANLASLRQWLQGRGDFAWPWHQLTGYQFVLDTLRAAFGQSLSFAGPVVGYQLFNLLLATLAVYLLVRLAAEVTRSRRVALLAGLALMTMPKFIAHSQNNPKDLAGLLGFTAVMLATVKTAQSARLRESVVAGILVGLALANHIICFLALPLVSIWILAAGRGALRLRSAQLALVLLLGILSMILFWPWLWPAPWTRLEAVLLRAGGFAVELPVLYMGEIHLSTELPAHYTLVSLLIATPTLWVLAAILGLRGLRAGPAPHRALCGLASLWLGILLIADLFARTHYDGVRHLLAALPALALLAALGADETLSAAARWGSAGRRRAAVALLSLLLLGGGATLAQLVRIHPYQDAFLNELVNAALPPNTEESFELEYWGQAYKEGAAWLAANAPAHAVIRVPIHPQSARPYLEGSHRLIGPGAPVDESRPHYVMFITRRALYDAGIHAVERTGSPVYTIQRQKATLLKIYRVAGRRLQSSAKTLTSGAHSTRIQPR